MTPRSFPRSLALAILVALAAAACGGSDGTTAGTESATVAVATVAPEETATVEATSRPTATPDTATPAIEPTVAASPTPEPTSTPELTTVVLDDGQYPSYGSGADTVMVPVFGTPAIHIGAEGRPRVVHLSGPSTVALSTCAESQCAGVDTVTMVDIAPAGRISFDGVGFDGDGRPMVLYSGSDNPVLPRESDLFHSALWCVDAACDIVEHAARARGAGLTTFFGAAFAGSPDGQRHIATLGLAGEGRLDIRLSDCTEPRCSAGPGDIVHAPVDFVVDLGLGFRASGEPLIAFVTQRANTPGSPSVRTLHLLGCEDVACASPTDPVSVLEGEPGTFLTPEQPLITDGRVTVVVHSQGDSSAGVIVVTCDDLTCADTTITNPITGAEGALAAALGTDGLPRIAWTDTMGQVNYSRCLDPTCAGVETTRLEATAQDVALAVTDDTVYIAIGPFPAHLLVCPDDLCAT